MRLFAALLLFLIALASHEAVAVPCSSYPYTLTNGTTADANQVMANFNTVLNCANSNLAPLASPTFTGTVTFPDSTIWTSSGITGATPYKPTLNGLAIESRVMPTTAACDGVTDDTAAFAAAATAAVGRTLYVPKGSGACVIATGFTLDSSLEMEPGATFNCTGNQACITVSGGGPTIGWVLRNVNITNSSANAGVSAVGVRFTGNTGSILVEDLVVYGFTAGKCIQFNATFGYTFIRPYIRNCGTMVDVQVDAGHVGVNNVEFIGMAAQDDNVFSPGTLFNLTEGNGWTFVGGHIQNDAPAAQCFDIGNANLGASDPSPQAMLFIHVTLEGNCTNAWRVGAGTYAGTGQQPNWLTWIDNPSSATISTAFYNLKHLTNFHIAQSSWPSLGGGVYEIIADSTVTNATIDDANLNSALYNGAGTFGTTWCVTGNVEIICPTVSATSVYANNVKLLPIFSGSFTSTPQALPGTSSILTVDHTVSGFSGAPSLIQFKLRESDAGGDCGYAQNDDVSMSNTADLSSSWTGFQAFVAAADVTNIKVIESPNGVYVANKSTAALCAISAGKWGVIVQAWK